MSARDAALLLLGHGSTLNADSSAPTYQHAEEIGRRGIFAEVHVGFWKEEPNFRQALRQTRRAEVFVVPNFISSGYFTEQIVPRELGLSGPVTRRDGRSIYYCEPVGLHPSMTEALLQRAREVVAHGGESIAAPSQTACLFICGHGTSFNDNSTKIIHEQATAIRALGLYADCRPVLMEQKPFVRDWRTLTDCPDVIVVPFFISDGLHSFEDIPVLLGLTHNVREKGFANPHHEEGRRLWYATAIGTEAFLADVILAQVRQFEGRHPEIFNGAEAGFPSVPAENDLERFFQEMPEPWSIGEILIRPGYELLHRKDGEGDPATLRLLSSLEEIRELIRLDADGNFRPLRAAPSLRRGWIYRAADPQGIRQALDYIYPAALANAALWRDGRLTATPWEETAQRQTGRFRIVREIDSAGVRERVAGTCATDCLKRRLWTPAAQSIEDCAGQIPLLCPEACNYLIGKAREKLKGYSED